MKDYKALYRREITRHKETRLKATKLRVELRELKRLRAKTLKEEKAIGKQLRRFTKKILKTVPPKEGTYTLVF